MTAGRMISFTRTREPSSRNELLDVSSRESKLMRRKLRKSSVIMRYRGYACNGSHNSGFRMANHTDTQTTNNNNTSFSLMDFSFVEAESNFC